MKYGQGVNMNGLLVYLLNVFEKIIHYVFNLNTLSNIAQQSITNTDVKYPEVHVVINHKCAENKKVIICNNRLHRCGKTKRYP